MILSCTATDGTLRLEAIKAEGGITFAQDDSAKYDSMPRSAIAGRHVPAGIHCPGADGSRYVSWITSLDHSAGRLTAVF